jgi:alkylated DNA repair protein (DNA oxidative demethylase)
VRPRSIANFGRRWGKGVAHIVQAAPFRHLVTPGGHNLSVAMTNCGRVGWVSDRAGYRYEPEFVMP